jgi:hypothetical protein
MSQGQPATGRDAALIVGVPLALALAGAWAAPIFFTGAQARGLAGRVGSNGTAMVGVIHVTPHALPAVPLPPGGTQTAPIYSWTVSFTGTLTSPSGVSLAGQTIALTVGSVAVGSVTVGAGGAFSGSFEACSSTETGCTFPGAANGQQVTLTATFSGATVGNYVVSGSTASGSVTFGTVSTTSVLTLST